jgi:hypothetical protein
MKRIAAVLIFIIPLCTFSQQSHSGFSPADYMWMNVGTAGFSIAKTEYTGLAFDSTGQPFVAYCDYGNSYKVTVMKFSGTNWVNVGNAGFSDSIAGDICLAISPTDNQPYVVFSDWGSSK